MTFAQVMAEMKKLGTAQNRKIYARHGMSGEIYGVSFANLKALAKKIKTDHGLAMQLWDSRNADARHLAMLIADPAQMTEATANAWVGDISYHGLSDMVAGVVAKTPFAEKLAVQWTASKDEWIGRAGWCIIAHFAMADNGHDDAYFLNHLKTIERTIHSSKNFTRHAMNMTVISIGLRNTVLEKAAIESAGRIGKVEVDHGETSCKTPDAIAYIKKAKESRKKIASRRKSK